MSATIKRLDPIFSDLLGVKESWTGYIAAHLIRKKGMNPNSAFFEDTLTDICTKLWFDLSSGGLKEKVCVHIKSTTDENVLANLIRPMLSSAIDYRFRSIIREFRKKNEKVVPLMVDVAQKISSEQEFDAENLKEKISAAVLDSKMSKTVKKIALLFLADRLEGMGLRELCEKHGVQRGGSSLKALKHIQECAETIVNSKKE